MRSLIIIAMLFHLGRSAAGAQAGAPADVVFAKVRNSVVVITCSSSTGSGFIVKDRDGKWLITNEHVIQDGRELSARTVDGVVVRLGQLQLPADDRDLARFAVMNPEDVGHLEIGSPLSPGQRIRAFGNSLGMGTLPELAGEVTALGPDRMEVTAEIVSGNSGGPILDNDGKVVGVSTYLQQACMPSEDVDWTVVGTRFAEVRRFGLRLDTAVQWVNVDAALCCRQRMLQEDIECFLLEIVPAFRHYYTRSADHITYAAVRTGHSYSARSLPTQLAAFYKDYGAFADMLKRIQESYEVLTKGSGMRTADKHDEKVRVTMYRQSRQEAARKLAVQATGLCKGPMAALASESWATARLRSEGAKYAEILSYMDRAFAKFAADVVQIKKWE